MKSTTVLLLMFFHTMLMCNAMEHVELKRNALPKKIIGNWSVDAKPTRHLSPGEADDFEKMLSKISFTKDKTALEVIPEKTRNKVSKFVKEYYVAGWCTAGKLKVPYIMTYNEGMAQIIVFTNRGDKKYSDPDALSISFAFGKDTKSDILYIVNEKSGASIAFKREG